MIPISHRNGEVSEKAGSGCPGDEFLGLVKGWLGAGGTLWENNRARRARLGQTDVYLQPPEGYKTHSGFNRFPPFPIDPLHFTDNDFYFSLFLLFVSFCLFVYRSVKHRKAGPEPIEVAEEQTQHPFQRPLTLPVALTLALSLALLVFALEISRTTWTYAMFQMPSDDVTDAMRDDPTFILLDIESNPHAVRVVRFIPAREMISMFSELERGGYSNAGEAATKFEKERRERLMLSRMFWAGAVAFGLITAIMIWKGSRRRRSSAAGQERGDQPPS